MLLSKGILEQGKSKRGGWSRAQVEALGGKWPLERKWKDTLLGKDIPDDAIQNFLSLKDVHKTCKRIEPTPEQRERRSFFHRKRRTFKPKSGRMSRDGWSKKTRNELLGKNNDAEQHVDGLLASMPVFFRREHPLTVDKKKYFLDFLVTSFKEQWRRKKKVRIAIEVDGGYHMRPEQQEKDRQKDSDLLSTCRVWSVVRIDARKALQMDAAELEHVLRGVVIGKVHRIPFGETPQTCTSVRCTFPACLC